MQQTKFIQRLIFGKCMNNKTLIIGTFFKKLILYLGLSFTAFVILYMVMVNFLENGREPMGLFAYLQAFFSGTLKTDINEIPMFFLKNVEEANAYYFAPYFFKTFVTGIGSFIFVFILSNALVAGKFLFRGAFASAIIRMLLSVFRLFSSLHIILIAIFLLIFVKILEMPLWGMIILVGISSGIFNDVYDLIYRKMIEMKGKNYILTARALGQNVFKQGLREYAIFTVSLFRSLWLVLLSNVLIAEILFSSGGIGYSFRRDLIVQIRNGSNVEINLVLASILILLIGNVLVNLSLDVSIEYLRKWRK